MTYIQDSFDEFFKMSNGLSNLKFIVEVGVCVPVRRPAIHNYLSFEFNVVFQSGSSLDSTFVGSIEAMNIKQQRVFLHLSPHLVP